MSKYSKLSEPHFSPLAERLAKKIKKDTGLDLNPEKFRRSYAGFWQKGRGTWIWCMESKKTGIEYGSTIQASELVKKKWKIVKIGEGNGNVELECELRKEEKK